MGEVSTQKYHEQRALSYSDAEILLTSAKRSGQTYYHLISSLSFDNYENNPTTLDGLALYFDSRYADYWGYNTSSSNGEHVGKSL